MLKNMVYRGLPPSFLFAFAACLQYFAIRAFV